MRSFARLQHSSIGIFAPVTALALLLTGCQSLEVATTAVDPGAEVSPNDGSELLRPGDVLKFTFKGPSTLQIPPHEERIPETGYVTLPEIGTVEAVGKTRVQLQEAVRSKYVPAHYRELSVTIAPAERFFYVSGDVKKPDRHPYLGKLTLTQAITAAGDFTEFGKKSSILITRTDGTVLRGDYTKALKNPTVYDIKIMPGDKIHVPRRRI
jgi:protein involved in polysaccharide export with SLBB domain